jgi:hypothetical protein
MYKRHQLQTRQRGMTIVPVMIFILGFSAVGISIMAMSGTQTKEVVNASDKWQADALASTAANLMYEQIRQQMIADQSFPFLLNQQTQKIIPPGGGESILGTCSARLATNRLVETDINGQRRQLYYFTVEATGTSSSGRKSVTLVDFRGEIWRNLVPRSIYSNNGAPDSIWFPTGAIVANGTVKMCSDQGVRTVSTNGDAHIVGNRGISWKPTCGSKKGFSNPNVIDCQGYFLVPDGNAYNMTNSEDGLDNSNGCKNYKSNGAKAQGTFPGAAANTVIKLNGNAAFPDENTVNNWVADYLNSASVAISTKYPSGCRSAEIAPRLTDGQLGIQSPALVTGDLDVKDGDTLHLWPGSTNPKKNIVYVKGNVKNKGNIINHGCTLIFEQTYEDTPSAKYTIEPDALTFKTKEEAVMKSALISLKKSRDAFKFHTSNSASVGLVFAMKGGIEIDGSNADFTGMLLAGGVGDNGDIDIKPGGGNSFAVHYESYSATGGNVVMDSASLVNTTFVAGNVSKPFTPTKLFNWNWLK